MDHAFDQPHLLHRAGGDPEAPALFYLPGVHGDWTHLWMARPLLQRSFHFVEIAYPRVLDWRLEDFAGALERLMNQLGIARAHLIGESFSSLVGWEFTLTRPERVASYTLVGGFAQPPGPKVHFARAGLSLLPTAVFESGVNLYCALRRAQPGVEDENASTRTPPYPAVRTRGGRLAAVNRLRIICDADYRRRLAEVNIPVRYIGGGWDIIVPVRREIATLEANLPKAAGFESHLIPRASHVIAATRPEETAERITAWTTELNL